MGFFFQVVSFIGGWLALGMLALGISAGLYIACDFAEEYSSIVKKYLQNTIYVICAIYLILIIDGLPYSRCLFGVFTHVFYTSLLSSFPFVQPVSIQTIGSFIITLINHMYWFKYFISHEYRYSIQDSGVTNAGMRVLGFLFIFVWLVPIAFFVSLQSIEDSLPFAGGSSNASSGAYDQGQGQYGQGQGQYNQQGQYGQGQYNQQGQYAQYQGHGNGQQGQKKKGGIFKKIIDSALEKKEAMFPGVAKRQY